MVFFFQQGVVLKFNVTPGFKTSSIGGNMSKLFVHIFMKFNIVLRNKRGTLHHLQSFLWIILCDM